MLHMFTIFTANVNSRVYTDVEFKSPHCIRPMFSFKVLNETHPLFTNLIYLFI